jgi:arabinofuranosyltransferase
VNSTPDRDWRDSVGLFSLSLALCGLFYLVLSPLVGSYPHGIDDADITLVYAENLARGHGMVYRPGGEHVEGSTSLLWTLVCAAACAVGTPARWLIPLASALFATLTVFLGAKLACQLSGPVGTRSASRWYFSLMALWPVYFLWTTTTWMDIALWSLCVTGGIVSASGYRRYGPVYPLAAAMVAMTFCRPEALVLCPGMLLLAGVSCWANGGTLTRTMARLAVPAAAYAVSTVALFAGRLAYFGVPFPNTYYAKVGSNRLDMAWNGMVFLASFVFHQPLAAGFIGVLVAQLVLHGPALVQWVVPGAQGRRADSARGALVLLLLAPFLLPLVEGRDHFPGGRPLQAFVPALAALTAAVLAKRVSQSRTGLVAAAVAVLGVSNWWQCVTRTAQQLEHEFEIAADGRATGEVLSSVLTGPSPLPAVGVTPAGGIAVAYRGPITDLLGLNFPAMALATRERSGHPGHSAFSTEVFWQSPPPIMVPRLRTEALANACAIYAGHTTREDLYLRGLLSSPRFLDEYEGFVADDGGAVIAGYVRRDFPLSSSHARRLAWPEGGWRACPYLN